MGGGTVQNVVVEVKRKMMGFLGQIGEGDTAFLYLED